MKTFFLYLPAVFLFLSGCDLRKKEAELQQKEAALNRREQELELREQALHLKEAAFAQKVQAFDSTRQDTVMVTNPALVGRWSVQMTCTETTCAGSAVGDTKNEQWEILYQGGALVAKARADAQLVREYRGGYDGKVIELTNSQPAADTANRSSMLVRLRMTDDTNLEGEREIVRADNCKIVYAVKMQKQ